MVPNRSRIGNKPKSALAEWNSMERQTIDGHSTKFGYYECRLDLLCRLVPDPGIRPMLKLLTREFEATALPTLPLGKM